MLIGNYVRFDFEDKAVWHDMRALTVFDHPLEVKGKLKDFKAMCLFKICGKWNIVNNSRDINSGSKHHGLRNIEENYQYLV